MTLKSLIKVIICNLTCALGGTLLLFGVISTLLFFSMSDSSYRFYFGVLGGVLMVAGYLMYHFALPHIMRKWDEK